MIPLADVSALDLCRCGHTRATHEHYRPGDDCGACGARRCRSFRPSAGGLAGWARARMMIMRARYGRR
jgi:hypothetical protein